MAPENKKIPLSVVKKLPYKTLMRMINKAKDFLKKDGVMQEAFKEYDVDIEEIDYIPTYFKELDVSAKTEHGVVWLSYKLLCDGDFFEDYSYLIHEYVHFLQQTTGTKPTTSYDDENYLDNIFEQEGFSKQVEFIANQSGEDEAEEYVDDLLDYHEIEDDKEKDKLEAIFLENV